MTVGKKCILGATDCASENSLMQGYGVVFALKPNYQPNTVNTDGWVATQNA
jgi:hypothetical protein